MIVFCPYCGSEDEIEDGDTLPICNDASHDPHAMEAKPDESEGE